MVDGAAFAQMRDGVRILNVARGGLIDEAALQEALDSGKVAGAALDVFRSEPVTDHPLFSYPNVIATPPTNDFPRLTCNAFVECTSQSL